MISSVYQIESVFEMIQAELNDGMVPSDELFDCIYPLRFRGFSGEFWSPTLAAVQAAKFLGETSNSILDVGSGSGKFLLIAAMLFPKIRFVGVEYRPTLAALSVALAQKASLKNVEIICGNAFDLDWNQFDGIFMFNPFHEQTMNKEELNYVDNDDVILKHVNFTRYAQQALEKFTGMKIGTKVSLYHAFHDKISLPGNFAIVDRSFIQEIALTNAIKK